MKDNSNHGPTENSPKTGHITLTHNEGTAVMVLHSGYYDRDRYNLEGNNPVKVMAGYYDMADIRFFRKDNNGNKWSTRSIIFDRLTIQSGETFEIKNMKGPEKSFVKVTLLSKDYFSFTFYMEDSQGNRYSYFRKNDGDLPAPGFIIENEKGETLYSGRFYPG